MAEISLEKIIASFPKRIKTSNKGTYGRALLVAGSRLMPGAAVLASEAALRVGCGLVSTQTNESGIRAISSRTPEIIFREENDFSGFDKYNSILIGPGLSQDETAGKKLEALIVEGDTIKANGIVIDADAVNYLAKQMELKGLNLVEDRLKYIDSLFKAPIIFTPHKAELCRLLGLDIKNLEIKAFALELKDKLKKLNLDFVFVLKDYETNVVNESSVYVNKTGNPGMSTAGSGDVLAGIITGLLAQGLGTYEAATLGVYLHGLAGDLAAAELTEPAMIASDIVKYLPAAIKKLRYN